MTTRTNSIPIMLLTGFLGVGKTSLLNHVLTNNRGLKIGVIVNDFGKLNIDSMLVSAQTDTSLELSNGCICCSVDEGDLDDAISQLAHRGSTLDYIIIEASGLAEPKDLATMLRLMKNEYAHFDSLITVVDAMNFERNNKAHASALDNLQIADIVVLNKIDGVTKDELSEIETVLDMAAPKARLIKTEHGALDTRLILTDEAIEKSHPDAGDQLSLDAPEHNHDHDHEHLHDAFTSISFSTKEPLDWVKFEVWADSLDANVFRAKGICYFGMKGVDQKFIFQSVGKRYTLKLDEWGRDETVETNLVVIGANLDEDQVNAQLEELIDTSPEDISADTLMDIFKYKR